MNVFEYIAKCYKPDTGIYTKDNIPISGLPYLAVKREFIKPFDRLSDYYAVDKSLVNDEGAKRVAYFINTALHENYSYKLHDRLLYEKYRLTTGKRCIELRDMLEYIANLADIVMIPYNKSHHHNYPCLFNSNEAMNKFLIRYGKYLVKIK
jgi:predicted house-cleaning noncanonical NTP pyrophosphatase (MazG superfamily)